MKTVIWDYNGTILDDMMLSLKIENMMLAERGLKAGYTAEQYRDLYRMPMIDYYRDIGYTFENESFADIAEEFNDIYDEHFDELKLCRGVTDTLNDALAKGYQNVILSSCENNKLHEQCGWLHIDSYFQEMMGIDNLLGEPKIEIGRHWMIRSGVMPDECIYLGDTTADYETAEALGIKNIILIASGHQSVKRLRTVTNHVALSLDEVNL